MNAGHMGEDRSDFLRNKDDRKVSGLFSTEGLNVFEGLIEDFSIEKNNGIEGLVLGGC